MIPGFYSEKSIFNVTGLRHLRSDVIIFVLRSMGRNVLFIDTFNSIVKYGVIAFPPPRVLLYVQEY